MDKWDHRFLALADMISSWSKDPSTQVGAVIVDPARRIVSTGYNGFARGVHDDPGLLHDRPRKYAQILHAEMNALLFAQRPLAGCTIYTTVPPCALCAAMLVQAGVYRVVSIDYSDQYRARMGANIQQAEAQLGAAGVSLEVTKRADIPALSGLP